MMESGSPLSSGMVSAFMSACSCTLKRLYISLYIRLLQHFAKACYVR
jgi:hypothetical protein